MGARFKAGREGTAQASGDRAKDKTDKIRATGSYQRVLGGRGGVYRAVTVSQFEMEGLCHGNF